MTNRRIFLSLTAAAAMAFVAPSVHAQAGTELDHILSTGTISIAVPQDFPPFGSVGTDMQPQGYDVDVARLIADALEVELELVPVTSANRIPYLQTNKVDLVISSMGKNPERDAVIDFTEAYAPFYNGIFAPEDAVISGPEDLSGMTVGVTRGSIEDLELTEIAPEDTTLRRYEDNNGTISSFLSGQVDAVATGNVVAAAIIDRNPPRKPVMKFLIQNSPCYIGLSEDAPELLATVNEIIAEAKETGALNKISQRWLGMDLPADL